MSKKSILITGGTGFIGSHLAAKFVEEGYVTKVLDNFASGRVNNINELFNYRNFRLIKGDITNKEIVRDAIRGSDVIFHLAAQIHVDKSIIEPERTLQVNTIGTLNILEAALQNDIQLLIYASTSEVYGSAQYVPMDEKHEMNPASPYAASKAAADWLFKTADDRYAMAADWHSYYLFWHYRMFSSNTQMLYSDNLTLPSYVFFRTQNTETSSLTFSTSYASRLNFNFSDLPWLIRALPESDKIYSAGGAQILILRQE